LASLRRSVAYAALLALCSAARGEAQGFVVNGELLHVAGGDTVPVPRTWVVLHAVTLTEGGPVDSQRTDARGRFRLRAAALDTAASYLVSAQYEGIGYFSQPIDPDSVPRDGIPPLFVYDTASTGAAIELAERHILVRSPGPDGRRRVIELFVLRNPEPVTRVVGAGPVPVWAVRIPSRAEEVEVGASDLAADAIEIVDASVQVFAPIVPGEREVLIGYLIPSGLEELAVTLDQPITRLSVLLGDSSAVLEAPRLQLLDVQQLEGQPLRRYGGETVAAGIDLRIRFGTGPTPIPVEWFVVPCVIVVMIVGFVVWRYRATPSAGQASGDPAVLAAAIAALDHEYRGREDEEYRRRRAELKQRLTVALAEQDTKD
jgi:hypothetical protein